MSNLTLFPEYNTQDDERLVIIGNGFDIAHGIKSQYKDFRNWVLKNGKDNNFIRLMDIFFSNQRDVWGDLETALGEYNEDAIIDFCKPDEEFDYDHPTRAMVAIEDGPDWIFLPVIDEIKELFNEWVNSIDIRGAKSYISFPSNSKFLTFNYTETLERFYNIPEKDVLHIHGSRLNRDEYIFGHCNYRDPYAPYSDDGDMLYIQQTQEKIILWMNEMVKDTKSFIKNNANFFTSLNNVKIVYTYGLSLNEVDWPYFEEIIARTGRSIPWVIRYHSKEDYVKATKFVSHFRLENAQLREW